MNSLRADSQHEHPTAEAWRRFIDGRTQQDEADSMERHLAECQSCVATVATFAGQADEFLARLRSLHSDSPVPPIAATVTLNEPPVADDSERIIGPYKLLQQLGEGGMGVVYMAEQTEPVRRRVALKIIKPGMDSGQVIARFEAERQALAMMDHQNIARVLDAGTTDTGRPFFVMELVKGVPITEYCDSNKLTVAERLALFVPVCQAIQHAHQKGIIHRDIKPSNVMVTLYDGKPVAKVIDFGVAKAIEQRLTERTMFTQYGQVIGTLEYMSPEQAEMSGLDIDTRSDIYSLGVLLYELLTGSTPISKDQLAEGGLMELLRMIREHEPVRPSTRLSDSHETLPTISAQRQSDPKKLNLLIRGELDWIVMKALDKDRTRRYETANGLARDIERYLNDEPVEACPPSTRYRMSKFARKNRGVLLTVAAFAVLLIAGIVVSSLLAVRATLAERSVANERNEAIAARNREADQRRQADSLRLKADQARLEADAARVQAETDRDTAVRTLYYSSMNQTAQQAKNDPRGASVSRSVDQWRLAPMRGDPRGWEWHLLNSPQSNETFLLQGHTVDCRAVDWRPGGEYLASAGFNDAIRVWCMRTGNEVAAFPAGTAVALAWSPDGKTIAAANAHRKLLFFEPFSKAAARSWDFASSFPRTLSWSPDGLQIVCGMNDSTIEIRNVATGDLIASVTQAEPTRLVRWSPDGRHIAATADNLVRVWDPMLRPLHELTGHAKQVVGLRWGSRESELWSAGGDGSITVWNAFEAKSERTVTCSGVEALGADWNPDGTEIAFCCWNRIVLADTQSGGRLADWYASRGVFGGFGELIKWSDDGARLSMALTSWSAPVPVWDVETMKRKHGDVAAGAPAKPIPSRQLPWMDWSKDGDVIASCAVDEIKIWDARRQQLLRTIDVRDAPSSCGRISPDGQRLAVAFRDVATKHLRVYALMDGAEIWSADLPQQGYSVDWSADGEWLAVASNADAPSPVHVLSASGRQLDVQYGTSMSYSHIAFEPAGKRLALADGYRIMIREAGATDGTLVMRGENYARNLMRWSRDGRRLACNMSEGLIRVATLGPEPSVIRLEGHSTHVTCLSWSWNDQRLASLDETGTLKVWDVAEGREILSLPNQAISLAWDPTGARLAYLPANGDLGVLDATPSYDREAPPEYLPVFERGLVTTPGDEPLRRSAAIALTRAGHWDRAAETIVGGDARDATLFQPGWWLVAQPETGADRQDADVARNRWPLGARWYRPIDPANGHVPTGGLTGTFWSRIYVPRETEAALVIGDGYAESYLLNGVALDLTAAKAAAGSNPICKLASLESGWNELAAIVPAEAEGDRFAFFCARISLDPIDLALAYADAGLGDKSATASAAVSDTQRDDPRLLRALQRR